MNIPRISHFRALASCIVLLAGCDNARHEESTADTLPRSATTITLTRRAIASAGIRVSVPPITESADTVTAPATLVANQDMEAHVGSFVSGRVAKVFVTLGSRVRRGQQLMQIEGLEIGEIKARFITAKSRYEFATSTLERQRALAEQNIGAKKSLLEAQAEFEKARAEYVAEDRKIHSIGMTDNEVAQFVDPSDGGTDHTSGTLRINAPIDGIVVERNVVIGQQVDVNTTAFCILDASVLWADAQVQEQDAARITGAPDVRVDVASLSSESFPGTVINVGETVDERTRTVRIRARLRNPQGRLKPQMFGHMHIPTGATVERVVLSDSAVVTEGDRTYVFVALNDTTFEQRPVRLGVATGGALQVIEGLRPGERVVTAGAYLLKSDMKIDRFTEE
jgi:membrane fusion protein, heavy metal efflux system